MQGNSLFTGEPAGGREKILRAVYALIIEEGYDSISLQRVADEAGLSKATVYHHFDDKDDLMLVFHESALSQLAKRLTQHTITDPIERLHMSVDRIVLGQVSSDVADRLPIELEDGELGEKDILRAFVEIRTRAVHDPDDRARISVIDQTIRDELAEALRAGIDTDVYPNVDDKRIADQLYTMMLGGLFRRTTTDDADIEAICDDIHGFIDGLRSA